MFAALLLMPMKTAELSSLELATPLKGLLRMMLFELSKAVIVPVNGPKLSVITCVPAPITAAPNVRSMGPTPPPKAVFV